MTLTRKDLLATTFTALAILVLAAAHQGWNVWLVGGSTRRAAGAITVLGALTCGLGTPGKDKATRFLAGLGIVAGALAVLAIATGSMTALSFLTADIVVLWALSTIRHAAHAHPRPTD